MSEHPKGAVALGRKMYFFKAQNTKECLISAHGGFWRSNSTFDVPQGVTIYFYAPHEYSLNDPGIGIARRADLKSQAVEIIKSGPCVNYGLSKYQGRHNKAGETYASIDGMISSDQAQAQKLIQQLFLSSKSLPAGIRQAKQATWDLTKNTKTLNIVTIRNRVFGMEVTLEEAIGTIRKAYPYIDSFHCSFCRSSKNPFAADKSVDLGGKV